MGRRPRGRRLFLFSERPMSGNRKPPAPRAPGSTRMFQDLMRHRIQHILLVSSLYDSFILTEDGQVSEALMRQFSDRNLSQNPDLSRVSSGSEAIAAAREDGRFDMIITSL